MEQISNLNIAITSRPATGSQDVGVVAYLSRVIDTCRGETQMIGTTAEVLLIEPESVNYIVIRNLSTSSDLIVDSVSGMNAFPQRVPPGGFLSLCPENTTIYAKGDSDNCQIGIIYSSDKASPDNRYIGTLSFLADLGTEFIPSLTPVYDATLPFSSALSVTIKPMYDATLSFSGNLEIIPGNFLYVQFDINWHDAGSINNGSDPIVIGQSVSNLSTDPFVSCFPTSGQWQFWSNIPPFNAVNVGSSALDTWQIIGMKLRLTAGEMFLTPYVDGVEYGEFDTGAMTGVFGLLFGAILSGTNNNFQLDNLLIGTSGLGSSDIFSADFTSSIVPPFDSITGTGLGISGGTLLVFNGGIDTYATKAISWP